MMVGEWSESHLVMSDSLWLHGLYSPWNSLGQNTGVDTLSFLQGIFPTQGLNPGLLQCRQILNQLSHRGSPRILGCVDYPFSSGSSRPRNWPRVACIAGGFFINWAIREAKRKKFIPIPKKGNAKECSNYCTIALISHASKVMLKILQARLHQYMNRELPDVQAGFRKGRGTRDQIANIRWIIKKARVPEKHLFLL